MPILYGDLNSITFNHVNSGGGGVGGGAGVEGKHFSRHLRVYSYILCHVTYMRGMYVSVYST